MKSDATASQLMRVVEEIKSVGLKPHFTTGVERAAIVVIGDVRKISPGRFELFPGVEKVFLVSKPYKLVTREVKPDDTVISIRDGIEIGGENFTVIAGPGAVESKERMIEIVNFLKEQNVKVLRGAAYVPQNSPYLFRGLGEKALEVLAEIKKQTGLAIITEVVDVKDLPKVEEVADIIQVGTRNMHNYPLLEALGGTKKPVLLKRAMSASVEEWLLSAEYILLGGNPNVILCERGIKTHERYTKYTLDISVIPLLRSITHLPVLVDPCHATGNSRLVPDLARASFIAGSNGLIIEVHPEPYMALADSEESLTFDDFKKLMTDLKTLSNVLAKEDVSFKVKKI